MTPAYDRRQPGDDSIRTYDELVDDSRYAWLLRQERFILRVIAGLDEHAPTFAEIEAVLSDDLMEVEQELDEFDAELQAAWERERRGVQP